MSTTTTDKKGFWIHPLIVNAVYGFDFVVDPCPEESMDDWDAAEMCVVLDLDAEVDPEFHDSWIWVEVNA